MSTKPDLKILDDLKAKYAPRDVVPIKAPNPLGGDPFYAAAVVPSRGEWLRFQKALVDEETRPRALEDLTRACVVYPEAAALGELLERLPGLAQTFGGAIAKAAGASGAAELGNW